MVCPSSFPRPSSRRGQQRWLYLQRLTTTANNAVAALNLLNRGFSASESATHPPPPLLTLLFLAPNNKSQQAFYNAPSLSVHTQPSFPVTHQRFSRQNQLVKTAFCVGEAPPLIPSLPPNLPSLDRPVRFNSWMLCRNACCTSHTRRCSGRTTTQFSNTPPHASVFTSTAQYHAVLLCRLRTADMLDVTLQPQAVNWPFAIEMEMDNRGQCPLSTAF